jgi:cytohesin
MGGTDPPPVSVADFRQCADGTAAGQYIQDNEGFLDLDLDLRDDDGFTPLHVVAEKGWTELVETVLGKNSDLLNDVLNDKKQSPLHVAILKEKYEVALQLLTRPNVDVNLADSEGQTPLHLAARFGNLAVVEKLLSKDLDANAIYLNEDGLTPLDNVVLLLQTRHGSEDRKKEIERIKELIANKVVNAFLESEDIDIAENYIKNYRDLLYADKTLFEDVVSKPNALILVDALLQKGLDVNTQDSKGTLLHYAIVENNVGIVYLLLKQLKVDVNATEKLHKLTPLHLAAIMGNEEIVRALLEKGANVDTKNKNDESPLHLAVIAKNQEIVQVLLEKGANVDTKNKHDETPLHLAITFCEGNPAIVQVLLEKGANVDTKNKHDETPLHLAITFCEGNPAIVQVLLEKGADVNAKSNGGLTPLYMAAMNGYEEIVKVLLKYNADKSVIPTDEWPDLSQKIKELLTPPSCAVCNTSA